MASGGSGSRLSRNATVTVEVISLEDKSLRKATAAMGNAWKPVDCVATSGDLSLMITARSMGGIANGLWNSPSEEKEVHVVRLARTLMVAVGLSVSALIAVPIGSALAVEHLNVSAASPLGHLGATTAGACGYRNYKTGWVSYNTGPAYVQENVQDWYDGCSAGNVSLRAQCWGRCGYVHAGSFWDASRGANTDWVNFQTYGSLWEPECVWLRFWTQPNGYSYWASGEYFGYC